MSLCMAGQVLLTKEAMYVAKNRTNRHTPKNLLDMFALVYKFKGVKKTSTNLCCR